MNNVVEIFPLGWALLYPVFAMVLLTAMVWLRMYQVRIAEMRQRWIKPQVLATARQAAELLQAAGAADNFRNLFEAPVLFYALTPLLLMTGQTDPKQLFCAWIYVALRTVHSFIHVTYNRVMHRFIAYSLSTLILFAMWGMFAKAVMTGS